jgi:transposase-like protein
MGKHRKSWTQTEKVEILNHYKLHGLGKTSKEYNVSSATIYRWLSLLESQGEIGLSEGFKLDKDREFLRMQREIQAYKEIIAEKELEIRIKDALLKKSL